MDIEELKIIDFDSRGNVVRFYLGDKNLQEHYESGKPLKGGFSTGYIDIVFPFDGYIIKSDNYYKDDMKNHEVPIIKYIMPEEWHKDNIIKFYLGDSIETNEKKEVFCNGTKIPGAVMLLIGIYPKESKL